MGKRPRVLDGASPGCYGSTEEGHLIQPEGVFLEEVTSELSLGGGEALLRLMEACQARAAVWVLS